MMKSIQKRKVIIHNASWQEIVGRNELFINYGNLHAVIVLKQERKVKVWLTIKMLKRAKEIA